MQELLKMFLKNNMPLEVDHPIRVKLQHINIRKDTEGLTEEQNKKTQCY
jgi:hypothetical protein